ncbi:YraN family protein [Rubellimicrobium arenae]|uniref:YraN family protein n=1 Tax=Rubellimicrobium arenae TaxID=2817372 RepID=UPI001B300ABC|nr:YraN family protein [Rubellimicrobium arenae]
MTRPTEGVADPREVRRLRGMAASLSGAAAEESVVRHFEGLGCRVAARRWRSPWGEVDLILRDGTRLIFVEVKKARSFDRAAHRLARRQMDRLCAAAQDFADREPKGSLTELRFDLALVDGMGRVRVIENAWGEDF